MNRLLLHNAERLTSLGYRLFPIGGKDGKHPLLKRWPERATVDMAEIADWLNHYAWATGLAILTSAECAVLDVDDERALLPELVELVEQWPGPKVRSGRIEPAFHVYGKALPGTRSRTRFTAGADFKAHHSFAVAPGSLHRTGRRYMEINPMVPVAELPEFPALVTDMIRPPAPVRPLSRAARLAGPGYAVTIYRHEVERVGQAIDGERNDTLNRASWSLGRFVGTGALELEATFDGLYDAAVTAGLEPEEAARTIHSGISAGMGMVS